MGRYKYNTQDRTTVMDTETGAIIPVEEGQGGWQGDVFRTWLAEGNEPDPFPAPTFADYVAAFTPGLQQWMEDTAKTNAYDSVLSCVSYKDSGVPQFAGDAAAMIAWRDALWRWASQWQAGFNGQLPDPIPTLEQVIALAPQPEDFNWVVHPAGTIIESQLPPVATA
ncbi:hypothetical protein [Luteibacter sp. SG786]|uniref:hypothetical protein n=1 Tax=Luteibacter sp. SG786 TaxID=2587130 RepID=UPI00142203C4|nr:hypothetical protein [Luteibacter sp. SG786]NII53597.1 hypothetical protein [Luteibacter sp. SG786]